MFVCLLVRGGRVRWVPRQARSGPAWWRARRVERRSTGVVVVVVVMVVVVVVLFSVCMCMCLLALVRVQVMKRGVCGKGSVREVKRSKSGGVNKNANKYLSRLLSLLPHLQLESLVVVEKAW